MHHTELEAWKQSIEVIINIYNITNEFPKAETYGLANQMQRAANKLDYIKNINEILEIHSKIKALTLGLKKQVTISSY